MVTTQLTSPSAQMRRNLRRNLGSYTLMFELRKVLRRSTDECSVAKKSASFLNKVLRSAFLLLIFSITAQAQLNKPSAAAVATAHPLATAAGEEILNAGGNAFDAAVAITAALAVVEPYGSGLGGGGFWLLHRANGFETMIDGRERAPMAASRDMYLDDDGEPIASASRNGALAAGIPGSPAAMAHLAERYGELSLARSLEPAIRYASDGFRVHQGFATKLQRRWSTMQASGVAAQVYQLGGKILKSGDMLVQPELARTLQLISRDGADGFYRGDVAARLVSGVRRAGGIWSLEDLRSYKVVERAPIVGEYRDSRIVSAAPPSSGGIAMVAALNILDGYDWKNLSPLDRQHLVIEAWRRVYRDRAEFLGDTDYVSVPIEMLTSSYYAAGLRAGIRRDRATPSTSLPGASIADGGENTTHFSVLDKDGNYVSATMSINFMFGSGFMPAGTGVLLNNEMDDFSAKPGTPNAYGLVGAEANAIVGGKRMLSSMSPTFVQNERGVAILGTPGGSRIISMVMLGVIDFIDGGSVESMVSKPRYHHQYLPDVIGFEPEAVSESRQSDLAARGHQFREMSRQYGDMQAIVWERRGNRVSAASDPRREGEAKVIEK